MSYAWGNQKLGGTKRKFILVDAIVPRSDAQYWVMIFVMLGVGALLLATLFDTSPVFR